MPIDRNALLALWKLEDIPACDEGMELARTFLESCGQGVDRLGIEEPADRISQIAASYTAMVEHGSGCEKCNEVEKVVDKKASNEPPAPDPSHPPELAATPGGDDLIEDSVPFEAQELTDEEIEDHDLAVEAGLAGKPNDDTKSVAWQRGWADAQE
jgi:hypothetical protein